MKFNTVVGGLLAACALALVAAPAVAATTPKYIVTDTVRTAPGGRGVQVLVAQSEIRSNINPSTVSVATGGGLIGALIDAKIEADRAKRAEAAIVPVRDAMTGFDADALALETTKSILAAAPWLANGDPAFGRDSSILGRSAVLDSATANQVVYFDYIYDLSADFSSVRVALTIQVADKTLAAGKKPEWRFQPKQLVYAQTLTAVVTLPTPVKELEGNATTWSADNARLARLALAQAFKDVADLAPRAFALQEAEVKPMLDRKKKVVFVGGSLWGRVQEEGPDGTLLFNGTFVRMRTLAP